MIQPVARVFSSQLIKRTAISAVGGLVVITLMVWANQDEPPSEAPASAMAPLALENLRSFTVRHDGQKIWELSAKRVELSPDGTRTFAGTSRGILFKDNKPFLHLSAKRVHLQNLSNNLEASGQVRATGPDKFSFETPLARWNRSKQLVTCPKPSIAHLQDMNFSTPQMVYQWDKGHLEFSQGVVVTGPGVTLKAPQGQASTKDKSIELSGGVQFVVNPKIARIPKP